MKEVDDIQRKEIFRSQQAGPPQTFQVLCFLGKERMSMILWNGQYFTILLYDTLHELQDSNFKD